MKPAVLVCGARSWTGPTARQVMLDVLSGLPAGTVVLHGAAPGADLMAGRLVKRMSLPQVAVPFFGWLQRAGGPARNALLLELLVGLRSGGREVSVLAFGGDAGTDDAVGRAVKAGIRVVRHGLTGPVTP